MDLTAKDVNDSKHDSEQENGMASTSKPSYSEVAGRNLPEKNLLPTKKVLKNDDKELKVTNPALPGTLACSTTEMSGDLPKGLYDFEEECNFIGLVLLLNELGTKAIRKCYRKHLRGTLFSDAVKNDSNIDTLKETLYGPQLEILNKSPELDRLDIALLAVLLKKRIGLGKRKIRKCDIDSVTTIQDIRNYLSHLPNIKLSQQDYNDKLGELKRSLQCLGIAVEDIEERLKRSIGIKDKTTLLEEYKLFILQLKDELYDLRKAKNKQLNGYIKQNFRQQYYNNPESFLHKPHGCHVKGNEFVVEVSYYGKIVKTHHIEHVDGGSSVQLLYLLDQQLPTDSPIPIIQMPDPEQANLGVTTNTMKIPIDIIYRACIEFKDGIKIKNEDGCFSAKRFCKIKPFCVSFSTQQPQKILNNGEWQNIFTYNEDELDPTVVISLGDEIEYKDCYNPNIPVTIRMTQCKALEELIVPPYSGTHGLDISDEETHMQEDQANIEATPGVIAM